ncbi:CHASE2 domain-containing serine/threonine-protein kinase [Pseudomonadota bacterium]
MKIPLWQRDWIPGGIIVLIFISLQGSDLLHGLERTAYDVGVRASTRLPDDRIAVIAIDQESIANIGRWPWPRALHTQLIDLLAQAKVIGHTVFFQEPQLDPGVVQLQSLLMNLEKSSLSKNLAAEAKQLQLLIAKLNKGSPLADFALRETIEQLSDFLESALLVNTVPADVTALSQNISVVIGAMKSDQQISESIKRNGRVILSFPFVLGGPLSKQGKPLPTYVTDHALVNIRGKSAGLIEGVAGTPPIPEVGRMALAVGHLNTSLDQDGSVRSEPLLIDYNANYIPAASLLLAAKTLNLSFRDISVDLRHGVSLGKRLIGTDSSMRMQMFFYGEKDGHRPFITYSFYDVISGRIPISRFAGKTILIGVTAASVSIPMMTPVDAAMAPVILLAHSVSSLLNQHHIVIPQWAPAVEHLVFLLIAIYLIFILPWATITGAAVVTTLLATGLLATFFVLITVEAKWLQLMTPVALLLTGYLLLIIRRYFVIEGGQTQLDHNIARSNWRLGRSHQEKGQLDIAFEIYRKSPLDDSILEDLYRLGLDYEGKGQFEQAMAVYKHMGDYKPNFRDIERRIKQTRVTRQPAASSTKAKRAERTIVLERGDKKPKPMLGRYRIEKEIGKGAMGVVYQGRDPQIDRVVAIKTLDLLQQVDEHEREEVKARFFREARAAGRLRHPNIVTIFDAGEQQDLAYIAMEFLTGSDLTRYIKPENLLPLPNVLRLAISAADALEYAHSQNVIHRDIKPANVMFELKTGSIKITDFGIARIADASKTKTGTVMGTPSYMSPEQIAGAKVDGRTDLFSLGVMLYQLVSGNLPFQADTLTNLMYKITNEEPPDILGFRPELASSGACLSVILNKVLQKQASDRYRSGSELSRELRICTKKLVGSSA